MSTISVDYDVLNQRGSPAWFTDTFANIPTAGYVGRMFISKDTFAFYRDTGTGWDLIGGPGIGTLTGSGVAGQVSFFNGTQVLAGNNNLFWDNTNSRLGINTTTPGAPLDIHGTGTQIQLNGTGVSNSYIAYQQAGASKWRVGNFFDGTLNTFAVYNTTLSSNALTISNTNNIATFSASVVNDDGLKIKFGSASNLTASYLTISAYGTTSPNTTVLRLGTTASTLSELIFSQASSYAYTYPSATGTIALTSDIPANIVTGTGASGQVGYWTGTATQSGSNNHFWDNTNNRLGINTTTPLSPLQVVIGAGSGTVARFGEASGTTGKQLLVGVDTATGRSELASIHQGTGATPLALNPTGGNVLVGTTTDAGFKLSVSGTGNFSGALSGTSATFSSNTGIVVGASSRAFIRQTSGGDAELGAAAGGLLNIYNNGSSALSFSSTAANFPGVLEVGSTGLNGKLGIRFGGSVKSGIDLRDDDDAANATFQIFRKGDGTGIGSITRPGLTNAVLYNTTSDYRLKEDYKEINGLEKLSLIKVYDFKWKGIEDRMDGVIAHELQQIIPYAVHGQKDAIEENGNLLYQGVDYSKLVPILIKSIQELNDKLVRNNIN